MCLHLEIINSSFTKKKNQSRRIMAVVESLLFGLFVIILIKCSQVLKQHYEMKKVLESIPEPKVFPIIGVAVKVFGAKNMFDYLMSVTETHGSPVKLWYGFACAAVVIDTPDDMKKVFNSENCLNKAPFYDYLNLGKGLFVSKKELWGKNRKILSRAFNNKMLETSIPVISEKSKKLVKCLSSKSDREEFDMMENVIDCVLETMFETILDMKTDEALRNRYKKDAER